MISPVSISILGTGERSIGALHRFQEELYTRMHKIGKLVSQDVSTQKQDYHIATLAATTITFF